MGPRHPAVTKATGADGFVYDGASRLVKGELLVGGVTKKDQFTYDGYGNLTNIRRTIGAANPEDRALPADTATNRLTIGTYDHAGNQTALTASFAPNQTYTYDPLDQMRARSVTGSRSFVYLYDADGERVAVDETTTGTTRMLTLRGLDGKVLRELRDAGAGWAWAKDYVYRGGTLLASVSVDGGIRHYHLDHLSTPRLHTDRCGAIAAELKSFPYGESATEATGPQNSERMRFTMHERDLGDLASLTDDLDYMHARYYSAVTGRFLGVDPVPSKAGVPATWGKYQYARSNPVVLVDPDGRDVYFQNPADKRAFELAAARNWRVARVLAEFAPGKGRDLFINRGTPASPVPDARAPASVDISIGRGLTDAEAVQMQTVWKDAGGGAAGDKAAAEYYQTTTQVVTKATITLSGSETPKDRLHELGYVQQALENPAEYLQQAEEAKKAGQTGGNAAYKQSASEQYADDFAREAAKTDPRPRNP